MAFNLKLPVLLLQAFFLRGLQGQLTGTTVTLNPTSAVAGTTPTSIAFGFTITTDITGDAGGTQKITIGASQNIFTGTGATVAFSATKGGSNDAASFVSGGVVTGSDLATLELVVANGVAITATSVMVVTITDQMSALGAAGQVVVFTMESTTDTTQVTGITGWTTVAAGSGNDPIVRFGELERAFELPLYVMTPLMTSSDLQIQASVFEGTPGHDEQWFDRMVLTHPQQDDRFLEIKIKKNLHELNMSTLPRREFRTIEVVMGYGPFSKPSAQSKLRMGDEIPFWFLGQEITVRSMTRWMTAVSTIGQFPRECVEVAGYSLHMITCSAPAVEYYGDLRDNSLKFAHLDMVFPEVRDFKQMHGLLPELWGVKPMSETTKSYVKSSKEAPNLDLDAKISKMALAGGLGMEELQKACVDEKQNESGTILTV